MKKKLLISLSSFGLVAGFWACGDGSVEPLNEETDGYVKAMLETQSIDFASQVADAKKNCAADVTCENEMAKAQGSAILIESSAAPTPESSDGIPQPASSSSSRDFFNNFSSRGPIGQQSSSSVAPVVVESSSSEVVVPAGQFGTCFAGLSTAPKTSAELGESVTWTFKPNTAVIKTNELLKIMINWSFPNGTPDSYAGTQGKTTGQTSYSVSGTKTAVASVTSGGATQEITCSPLRVNGQKIEGCECLSTNIQPDVSKGESATWKASGCTSKANIIGYTWKGATADATGLVATAPVTAKGDEVKGVSFTVENDDSTSVTIQCEDAKAIDMRVPDYELTFEGSQIPQTGIAVKNEGCVVVSGTWTAQGYNPKLSVICQVDCEDMDGKYCYQTTDAVSISVGSGTAVTGQYSASASALLTNSLSGTIDGKSVCVNFSGMVKGGEATCKLSTN